MKRILVLLTIIAIIGVIASLVLNFINSGLNQESKNYVDKTIKEMITSWNPEILIKQASPQLLKDISPHKIRVSFNAFKKRYGSLQKYEGSSGQVGVNIKKERKIFTAIYSINARFKRASAVIQVQLIRNNDQWQILAFQVNPKTKP
ncbi:MAG: hypothetical protein HQ564_01980 [Candidatus Saganbacteria bacterium]|nr:hypothetical protein [Candidatus Saganbacteria bacterium]